MSATIREITWDELIDQIRAQSERIHDTDADERRLTDPAMLLMDIRELPGLRPINENRHVFAWLEQHELIENTGTIGYTVTDKGAALADRLIMKENTDERLQRRNHLDDRM